MTSQINQSRPCPHCKGTGVVVVKAARGGQVREERHPCPVCRGAKTSNGIATK